jgi:hypothetical protein
MEVGHLSDLTKMIQILEWNYFEKLRIFVLEFILFHLYQMKENVGVGTGNA